MQTFAPTPAHFQSMSGPPPANPYMQSYMTQNMFQTPMQPSYVNPSSFPPQLPMSQSGSVVNSTTAGGLTSNPASSQQTSPPQHMFQMQPQMMMQHGYSPYQPNGYPGTYLQPAHVLPHPQAPYYPPTLSTSLPIANSTNSSVSNAAASAVAAAMAAATASNTTSSPGTAVSAAKELAMLSGVGAGVKRKFSDDKTASPATATATLSHASTIVATPADYPRATRVKIEHAQLTSVTPVRAAAAASVSPLPATIQHTVGSHAQMRRYKHKEVEVRRRRKIANLFNELSELLECGPTDKASMLALASKFIRKAKERGMKPNDPEEESDKSVSSSQSLSPVQSHQTLGKKQVVQMTSGPASAATVVVSAVTTPVASDSTAETSEQVSAAAAAALAKAKASVKVEPTEEEEEGEDEDEEEDDA